MSNSTEKQYYLEVSRHTLQAIRAAGSVIEFWRESTLDQKAVDETLAGWSNGARVRAITSVLPAQAHWHLSSADEAARHRTDAAIRTFAASLPHGFTDSVEFAACLAEDGTAIGAGGKGRWVVGVVSDEALTASVASVTERNVDIARLESATISRIGGLTTAVRNGASGPVWLWDIGLDRSHILLVTSRGVEAVAPCAAGFDALFGSVQTALGLKMKGAAARLFFNDTYDFSEAGPRIAAELAPVLKSVMAGAPAAGSATAFACAGLTSGQSWFTRELARAVGLEPFAPDMAKLANQLQLQIAGSVDTLSAEAIGLLHTASANARKSTAWHPAWSRPGSAPAVAPMAAAVVPAKAGSGAAPSNASAVIKGINVPEPARSTAQPAAAVAVATLPQAKPETKAAPVAASQAKASPKVQVTPPARKDTPAPKAVTPPAPPPAKVVATSAAAAAPAGKRRVGLYIGIAIGLAIALLAGKFYFDAQAAKKTAEKEKLAAIEQMKSAAARARELELQVKAEAERIRKEAEAARETAVALARQQAEAQTRAKITAEITAERIANSPGILIVTTSPIGAAVSIDGGVPRVSPLSIDDIMPGEHSVSITMPGYEPVELTATIAGTKTTDLGMIQLLRATGTLSVASTPDRLEFVVHKDGAMSVSPVRQGRTPAQFDDMPPGDYTVTFSRPGWPDRITKVSIAKRERTDTTTEFASGSVLITSTPTNALIKRNGVVVGTTPLALSDLPPAPVSYEISLPNYDPVTLRGEIAENQQINLNARLLHVDHIAAASEVVTAPEAVHQPEPRISGVGGTKPSEVRMSFLVWRDGTTRDIQVQSKVDKELASVCIEALSKWRFRPGMNADGRPLNVRVVQPIKIVVDAVEVPAQR